MAKSFHSIQVIFSYSVTPTSVILPVIIDGSSIPTLLIPDAAGTSIAINAGPTDTVILRHFVLNGAGIGTTGIQFISGQKLIIEDCKITNFTGTAIDISPTNAGSVVIRNTAINNVPNGITVNGSTSPLTVSLENVSIEDTGSALDAFVGNVAITDSFFQQNTTGVIGNGTSVVSCKNTLFASNTTAIQSISGAAVEISNNDFYDNTTGIDNTGGGVVATANNNRQAGATTPGSPTSPIVIQ